MLKKFLLVILLFNLVLPVYSLDTASTLTKLEDATFGVDYSGERTESRLNRLEQNIYGKPKSGSVQSRLAKLNKDMSGDVIGKEIPPTADTFMDDDVAQSDGTENYPIINEIEQKLFNHSTPEKSLHSRIVGIEKRLFNKTFETEDYFDRMERIKAEYYNENPPIVHTPAPELDSFYAPSARSADEYELAALEERILRHSYPNESINERLSRLENKVFDTDFFFDDAKIRLDRLASATKAKKSFKKYDNNKFYSKLNTAMQIGTMVLMILAFVL